jgi:uncharacterized membrane protein YphA (DoxX/SURF4 family)
LRSDLGRHVFGIAALTFGFVTFAWHDYNAWHRLQSLWGTPLGRAWVYAAAIGQILGGLAIQWRVSARAGAAILGSIYSIFALLWVPGILADPKTYDTWGNFFEQFSLVVGALIVFRSDSRATPLVGRVLLGICAISFALEQAFYLQATAGIVPGWIPPNPTFWAILTTIAFALAAVSLLTGFLALLAARLMTLMIVLFGFLVWMPRTVATPSQHLNWGAIAENFAIAGVVWVLADLLTSTSASSSRPESRLSRGT